MYRVPWIIFLVCLAQFISGHSTCIGTCYSGDISPQDVSHGKHLQGYSYKNFTIDDRDKCYRHCVQDCRCKACQIKDATCELLDEDKTSKTLSSDDPGYVYIHLKQDIIKGKSHMVPRGRCYNGCCRSNPCMYGGKCVEQCQSPKNKFYCNCSKYATGKLCETILPFESCMAILKTSKKPPKDGVYNMYIQSIQTIIPLYCSFNRSNQAWALIESSSLMNRKFRDKTFAVDFANNLEKPPFWTLYRTRHAAMLQLRNTATMYRSTCNFDKRKDSHSPLTPDYLLGYFKDNFDIIKGANINGMCLRVAHVNIRGHDRRNVSCFVSNYGNMYHFHIDSYKTNHDCRNDNGDTAFPRAIAHEDNFGYYENVNKEFTCTATQDSTTQWWLGEEK